LGAETAAGRAFAAALTSTGARTAVVAAVTDADAAFTVQRLAGRIGAMSQAIDATNEMAVRVMTRQVSKTLGGLDLVVFCAHLGEGTADALAVASRFAAREMARADGGVILVALPEGTAADVTGLADEYGTKGVRLVAVQAPPEPNEGWARDILGTSGLNVRAANL
jgi:hypothetical protein